MTTVSFSQLLLVRAALTDLCILLEENIRENIYPTFDKCGDDGFIDCAMNYFANSGYCMELRQGVDNVPRFDLSFSPDLGRRTSRQKEFLLTCRIPHAPFDEMQTNYKRVYQMRNGIRIIDRTIDQAQPWVRWISQNPESYCSVLMTISYAIGTMSNPVPFATETQEPHDE